MFKLMACALLGVATAVLTADVVPSFKITTRRNNDRVGVKFEKDKVIFSVESPYGIGNAAIQAMSEKWPDAVVLRLHLKGLENFNITNGKVTLEGSASLQGGKPVVRVWMAGRDDAPLDAKSPYWMEVRILDAEGTPANKIPLRNGYFEMVLPKPMFEGNPKLIRVDWIDFYRN